MTGSGDQSGSLLEKANVTNFVGGFKYKIKNNCRNMQTNKMLLHSVQ